MQFIALFAKVLSEIWRFNCLTLSFFTLRHKNNHMIPEKLNQSTSTANFNDQTLNYYPLTVTVKCKTKDIHTRKWTHSNTYTVQKMKMETSKWQAKNRTAVQRKQIIDGGDGHQNNNNNHSCKENSRTKQQTSGGCLK